jgi:YgiT-type zinc finger domain-containing protein
MKMTDQQSDLCPLCGGNRAPGKITFTADLGTGLVVVRRVSATVCVQCGEEWMDDATARRLEQVVKEARAQRREVDVTAFA